MSSSLYYLLSLLCLTLQAKVKPNKDKNRTYTVTYVPKVEGVHKVNFKLYKPQLAQTFDSKMPYICLYFIFIFRSKCCLQVRTLTRAPTL